MKAISEFPGHPYIVHEAELPKPTLDQVPHSRGVLVKILRVGVDGADQEIDAIEYGAAPPGYDFLVIGHERFGRVEAVGPDVTELKPGDHVVGTMRRSSNDTYDAIGTNDMTTDDTYYERGISLGRGLLTEYYVDDVEFIAKVPEGLRHVGGLLEPSATGKAAINGNASALIFQSILGSMMPAPPLLLNPELPSKLEEIISKLLKKDRKLRYQGAAELRTAVARPKRDTESPGVTAVKATAAWRRPGGRWRFAFAGVLAGLPVGFGFNRSHWRERLLGGGSRGHVASMASV